MLVHHGAFVKVTVKVRTSGSPGHELRRAMLLATGDKEYKLRGILNKHLLISILR